MSVPPSPSRPVPSAAAEALRAESEPIPWVAHGLAGGLLGASLVALFFLVVDLLQGRAFFTPSLLGSVLFRGEVPAAGAPREPVLVLGYTLVHVAVFVAFALPAAFWALARLPSARGWGRAGLLGLGLFLGFEVVFVTLAELYAPGLTGMLGAGRVAAANALAAIAMASFLLRRAERLEAGADARRPGA